MPPTSRFLSGSVLGVWLLFGGHASAQTRPAFFDQPSETVVVGTPDVGEQLPVVVFLPATGGTSRHMFELARSQMPLSEYIAILPPGAPSSSDYLPNFSGFVGWMETRVLTDLERVKHDHGVDVARVFLVGFSLGGDTSWALLTRRPEVFRGAVVMGSRASARARSAALGVLRARHARVAFAMGRSDDAVRVRGAESANASMVAARVPTELVRYDGSHEAPDPTTLRSLLTFVMTPPSP